MYRRYVKRWLDVLFSIAGIVVLALLMLACAVAVKLDSKGPVLFWQKRVGRNQRIFWMPKFRTMYMQAPPEVPTDLMHDSMHWITPIGKILRRTSMDELPQLFCILAGSMSVVGPRPVLSNQTDLIELREHNGANKVRPGLTGWAQVNGRDMLKTTEKAKLDGEYVERMSFLFDCKCVFSTVRVVLLGEGVREGGQEKEKQSANNG